MSREPYAKASRTRFSRRRSAWTSAASPANSSSLMSGRQACRNPVIRGRGAGSRRSSRSPRLLGCRFRRTAGVHAATAAGRRSGVAVELRTKLTDAGAAARRKLQGLRGRNVASIAEAPAPDGAVAGDEGQVVATQPSESLVTQAWAAVKRAPRNLHRPGRVPGAPRARLLAGPRIAWTAQRAEDRAGGARGPRGARGDRRNARRGLSRQASPRSSAARSVGAPWAESTSAIGRSKAAVTGLLARPPGR
jgi:hypothetical protein